MRIRTYTRAHILQTFHEHCQSLAANCNVGYQREFEELNETGKEYSSRAGELDANKEKNRYPFILPYDHSRVRLSLLESQPHSDYINANYVPGGSTEHDFICTQAPLPSTMADFWRMVWEQNVHVIVMVTALKDNGKVMCNQYWPPEKGTGCYGSLQVTTVSRHHGPDCYITTIHLRQHGYHTDRQVTHYHYPGWPDHGVPKDLISLCAFTEHVRKQLDDCPGLGPTVVHCSAGVGRSGTFVALLWLMQLCVRGVLPDVRLAVQDLRRHRAMMVQNLEQYILVHQCLLHWLGGNMSRPSTQSSVHFQTIQPQRHFKRDRRSRRRHSDHSLRPESAHFSHHTTRTQPTPQPQHTTKMQHTPQPQQTMKTQHTPQLQRTAHPQHTPQPQRTSRTQHTPQPQRTAHPQDTPQSQRTGHPQDTPQSQRTGHPQDTPQSQRTAHPQDTPQFQRTAHPQDTPQFQRTAHPQDPPQPQCTAHPWDTPLPPEPPHHTTWQSLQNSFHTFHPGKLLKRILPQSSRLSSQTSNNPQL